MLRNNPKDTKINMRAMFSVVVPLYNKEFEVEQTLDAIFLNAQLLSELIIVDNNSTDGGVKVVEDWINNQKIHNVSVKLIREFEQGVTHARYRGSVEASMNWIAFCDADDLWYPNKLEKVYAY